jgi:uncharacterized lipoprotein YmbA
MISFRAKPVPLLAVIMVCAGCASSPPVRYFGLTPVTAPVADGSQPLVLGLGPVDIPDYLQRPQLVSRAAGNELRVDEFNRWAEPLDNAFRRTLAMNVDALVDGLVVVEFPAARLTRTDYRLVGRVSRFDAAADGRAVLEVQWALGRDDGKSLGAPRWSSYSVPIVAAGDPASQVAALNESVELFSRDIALALRELISATPAAAE